MGVGSTTLGFGWSTGYIYFTAREGAARASSTDALQPWVSGKDIVLELLRRWGAKQSQGMSVELVDANRQLPIVYRNTIANMMAEAEALNGIFAPDDDHLCLVSGEGHRRSCRIRRSRPGADARYEIDETIDLDEVAPMIAKPFSPGNAFPAEEVARERITFDKAMIGSCTNGSYDDLLTAALVIRAARAHGAPAHGKGVRRVPRIRRRRRARSSGRTRGSAASRSRMCSARWADRSGSRGADPCFGQGPDALAKRPARDHVVQPQLAEPDGLGGEGYLASPAVVAASAIAGYMAPPSELGLEWDPEEFGV